MHWRHPNETNETVSQRGARQADLAAQVIDCPTPRDVAVRHGQMYGLKQAMNHVSQIDAALAERVVQLDTELADTLAPRLSARDAARLFPTITVSGVKG